MCHVLRLRHGQPCSRSGADVVLQSGVVYSPISQADNGRKTGPASFHGLSIDPDEGTIARADSRRQVVRLIRRP
jgi:hypothetical protein